MDNHLQIPDDKRHLFSQPLDTLIHGSRKETIPKVEEQFKKLVKEKGNLCFYTVGDIVTKDFLSNEFLKSFVRLCIIDEKTKRVKKNN